MGPWHGCMGEGPRPGAILLRREGVVVGPVHEIRYNEKYGMDKRKSIHAETICIHTALFPLESLEWMIEGQGAFWGRKKREKMEKKKKKRK